MNQRTGLADLGVALAEAAAVPVPVVVMIFEFDVVSAISSAICGRRGLGLHLGLFQQPPNGRSQPLIPGIKMVSVSAASVDLGDLGDGIGVSLTTRPQVPLSSLFPDVQVDLGVEVHEEDEGNDANGDEPEPVEPDRVDRVGPELRHVQGRPPGGHVVVHAHPVAVVLHHGVGAVGGVADADGPGGGGGHDGPPVDGDLEELGHVEEDGDYGDGA